MSKTVFSRSPVISPTVPTLMCWFKANEVADLIKPSSSAPEKFLVSSASLVKSTSLPNDPFSFIFLVLISKICFLPSASGK
ncbi:hypothetical protein OGAPHI_002364 [Ogataea philodendri]|uniref:Uncharacterized protein n=1 Tax=Ogataea philodendri TaxID=1378263 RepID=A0A9P8PBB9_9ASCO|nr:uncharacterized protein OGAPHI_002364 [Ogataea philodendri]KAH3668610.1 hypothetical protein OGAPHI_002364 [Ogataea philodendri]